MVIRHIINSPSLDGRESEGGWPIDHSLPNPLPSRERGLISKAKGFSLIELIVVMALLVIFGFAAVVKFDLTGNKLDAVAKVLRSNIQFAQDLAMTHGSTYGFRSTSATAYEIYEGAPGTPAKDPLSGGNLTVTISPVQFSGTVPTFSFNSAGKSSNIAAAVILLTDGTKTRTVTVTANTGFVTVTSP